MCVRLSLRTFLGSWIAIALVIGLWLLENASTNSLIASLRLAEVSVVREKNLLSIIRPSYVPVRLYFTRGNIDEALLRKIKRLRGLQSIAAEWTSANSRDLNLLIADIGVEDVTFLNATDALMPLPEEFKNVRALSFHGNVFHGNSMESLARWNKVAKLDVSDTSFTDDAIKGLAGLESLTQLNLDSTLVTDEGVKVLGSLSLKNLISLSADCQHVSGDAAKYLAGMKLEFLKFYVHRRGIKDERVPFYGEMFPKCKFVSTFLLGPSNPSLNSDSDEPFGSF